MAVRAITLRLSGAVGALALLGSFIATAHDGEYDTQVVLGKHIAEELCSACHAISPEQEFSPLLTSPAPNFSEIAARQGMNEERLVHFITTTHWDPRRIPMSMPNPGLNREQTIAVARYIMRLRERQARLTQ